MSPVILIVGAALREAGIEAEVDLHRNESRQTLQIRVMYADAGRPQTIVYDLDEFELYRSRDQADYVRAMATNLVEYTLKRMGRAPKIWSDALVKQFYEKTIGGAIMASGGPPPPAPAIAPAKSDGPRLLDLDSAAAEPKPQPKRQIDV